MNIALSNTLSITFDSISTNEITAHDQMSTQVLEDVRCFNGDPLGVSDALVDRIKTALRERHPARPQNFKIAPNTHLPESGLWIIYDDGNMQIADDLSHPAEAFWPPSQETEESKTFFSTDPDFLVKRLVCDGGCNCTFDLETPCYTDGTKDFCTSCFQTPSGSHDFTLTKARERCVQYGAEMLSDLNDALGARFRPAYAGSTDETEVSTVQ